jgi:2-oxoisovalerate dehydrogenase E2 component (dihydrolipoyl transacylase)
MSSFTMKLPDVGEGVAEAEIVEWLVAVGDEVDTSSVLAEVLTDKATIEISSPVTGVVTALHGEPGDIVAVGSDLVEVEIGDPSGDVPAQASAESSAEVDTADEPAVEPAEVSAAATAEVDTVDERAVEPAATDPKAPRRDRVLAAPAVRARAQDLRIDLASVVATGPDGRVVHADLDRLLREHHEAPSHGSSHGREERVRGIRRKIAERLTAAWTQVPHITYVEAVDVTELERVRAELNRDASGTRLTLLPFLARALVLACREQPALNAHYDHAAETMTTFEAVHVGIATHSDAGLRVPVVRHAESRSLQDLATEIDRVTSAAREGTASREELSGSTITITSLGALGGIATTPILNAPEVSIIGVNKIEVRPVWAEGGFVPRRAMNLSCSFDHRMVDGMDAARFVQRIRRRLETPALLFMDGRGP